MSTTQDRETEVSPAPRATSSSTATATPTSPLKTQLLQMSYEGGVQALSPGGVHAAAAQGVSGGGGALPHGDAIQASFGKHDVSSVQAHVGGSAASACDSMGADAYATGSSVAFKSSPTLHTAAHEAAHVVQQRGGVQLKGGVGQVGDVYERHADAVADKVVAGQSAEGLLDQMAGGSGGGAAVQRVVSVDGNPVTVEGVWGEISAHDAITGLNEDQRAAARTLLGQWIDAEAEYVRPWMVSENREYDAVAHLAVALAGEVRSAANLAREGTLAGATYDSAHITAQLGSFITRLQTWHNSQTAEFRGASDEVKGRYSYYYSSLYDMLFGGKSIGAALASPPGDLDGRIALASDYALRMRRRIRAVLGEWDMRMPADADAARKTHWNPDETSAWVIDARARDIPLSAGPSATTAQLLTLAESVGASAAEKEALAWGIFAFFNRGLHRHKSGTHRFHEVMAIAAGYGVAYVPWEYGEVPTAEEG